MICSKKREPEPDDKPSEISLSSGGASRNAVLSKGALSPLLPLSLLEAGDS